MSSGLYTPLEALLKQRATYEAALREAGHSDATAKALLGRWVVSKHVHVAPTDAQARAEAEGPQRWYLDSFARSMQSEGLRGLSESVHQTALAAVERIRSQRWEEAIESKLLIGSPATVRRRIAELRDAGVGELICWMNAGGIPPEQVRRSMRLFTEEVMPKFRGQ
jgi:alkanesulfonate monooxygenase SsuD/methylene tetrahydromethanopterin reductase-like flavin-dependent oxidoreductase (luciferase family)